MEDCDSNYDLYVKIGKNLDQSFLKEKKPENEVDFYFLVMAYVRFLSDYAAKKNVKVPVDGGFGFDAYINKDTVPSKNILDDLYKQSKMLAKILVLLFNANDYELTLKSIVREGIVDKTANDKKKSGSVDSTGTLDVNKTTFARVSGPKSYLISLEFECYTSTLRRFFNLLQEYNFPVLIRDFDITATSKDSQQIKTHPIDVKLIFEWVFPRPKVAKTIENVLSQKDLEAVKEEFKKSEQATSNEQDKQSNSAQLKTEDLESGQENLKNSKQIKEDAKKGKKDAEREGSDQVDSKQLDQEQLGTEVPERETLTDPGESGENAEEDKENAEQSGSKQQNSSKKKSSKLWFKQAEEIQ